MYKQKVLIVLTIIIGLVACTPAQPSQPATTQVPAEIPTSIVVPSHEATLKNDPKNATYLIENQAVTLVNGSAETELAPGSASKQVTTYFGNEVVADLNADGLIDTAFLLTQDNGGSGTFFYVVVALQTADGYVGTNAIFLGDRIAPQSTALDPYNPAQFVVSYAERGPNDPMSAQPSQMVSKTFTLENGLMVEVAPAQ